jgi:hypothetical protein
MAQVDSDAASENDSKLAITTTAFQVGCGMDFLAELLNDVIIYVLVQRFAVPAKNATAVVVGALGLFVGVVALAIYLFALTPASVDQYYVTTITYSQCYSNSEDSVILQSDNGKYFMDTILLQGRYNYRDVAHALALNDSSEATVWLKGRNSNTIRGISTPGFKIDPTVGVEADNANRRAVLWIAICLFVLGAACIIGGLVYKPYDPDSSPSK